MATDQWTKHLSLPAVVTSAPMARHFVSGQLRNHHVADEAGEIALVTSELATNAIRHAHTQFTVTVRGDTTGVSVSVRDSNPEMGAFQPDLPMSLGGRGLRIADALSDAWGVDQEVSGKSVWALFTIATAPA